MDCYAVYYIRWQGYWGGYTNRSGVQSKHLAEVQIEAKTFDEIKKKAIEESPVALELKSEWDEGFEISKKWGKPIPGLITYCPPMDSKKWWIGNFVSLRPDFTVTAVIEGRNRSKMNKLCSLGLCYPCAEKYGGHRGWVKD